MLLRKRAHVFEDIVKKEGRIRRKTLTMTGDVTRELMNRPGTETIGYNGSRRDMSIHDYDGDYFDDDSCIVSRLYEQSSTHTVTTPLIYKLCSL